MKNLFKVKLEKLNFNNYKETGRLSEEIATSNLSSVDKLELLEYITDKK